MKTAGGLQGTAHSRHGRRTSGFTLIELMVTISIAAVLLAVGVPSFVAFQRNSELTGAANSLLSAINAVRGEAMKENTNSFIVPNTGGWVNGWTLFVDNDLDNTKSAGDRIIATYNTPLPSYFEVVPTGSAGATVPYLSFNGSGYPRTTSGNFGNASLNIRRNDISGAPQLEQTRRVMISKNGRVRVCKPTSASDPDCPETPSP